MAMCQQERGVPPAWSAHPSRRGVLLALGCGGWSLGHATRPAGTSAAAVLSAKTMATGEPIVLGHTYPASGLFAATASEMKQAIDGAVALANDAGGVAGRPLRVVSLDDGYDPQRSLANAERLRTEHKAIALLAPVGTPSVAALMPWALEHRMPLIGARSGADVLRSHHPYVFFHLASFGDEARHIARHLDTLGRRRVALAVMDNTSGWEVQAQFSQAARERGLQLLVQRRFALSGQDAVAVAQVLADARADAVVLAGGGEGAVKVLDQLLERRVPAARVYALSLLQPSQVHRELGARANGMAFAQVTPPLHKHRELPDRYRTALARLDQEAGAPTSPPKPTQFGFEGFLAAQIALRALALPGATASGAALTGALERLGTQDLGGWRIHYDSRNHNGSRYVDMGLLSDGRLLR